jgi:CheY-like chemotaxis protein
MSKPDPCRILIIDDNPAIHDDFRKVLVPLFGDSADVQSAEAALFGAGDSESGKSRFEIEHAQQGAEGLGCVQLALQQGRPYSLAFVDVRMPPGWDGIETISQLWKAQPDLQVVICTAYSDYSWEEIQQRLGQSDSLLILKKPFDNAEVLQLAQALTRKWRTTRQTFSMLDDVSQLVQARMTELEQANAKLKRELDERSQVE